MSSFEIVDVKAVEDKRRRRGASDNVDFIVTYTGRVESLVIPQEADGWRQKANVHGHGLVTLGFGPLQSRTGERKVTWRVTWAQCTTNPSVVGTEVAATHISTIREKCDAHMNGDMPGTLAAEFVKVERQKEMFKSKKCPPASE